MALPDRGHRPRKECPRGSQLTDNIRTALRDYRLMLGLTLNEAGARYVPPVSGKNVHDVENGWGEMTVGRVYTAGRALGIDVRFTFTPLPDDEETDEDARLSEPD